MKLDTIRDVSNTLHHHTRQYPTASKHDLIDS